jgi:hypothetical protein
MQRTSNHCTEIATGHRVKAESIYNQWSSWLLTITCIGFGFKKLHQASFWKALFACSANWSNRRRRVDVAKQEASDWLRCHHSLLAWSSATTDIVAQSSHSGARARNVGFPVKCQTNRLWVWLTYFQLLSSSFGT